MVKIEIINDLGIELDIKGTFSQTTTTLADAMREHPPLEDIVRKAIQLIDTPELR